MASKKKPKARNIVEVEPEVTIPPERPRMLDDVVSEMALARAGAVEVRQAMEPHVAAFARAAGDDPEMWAVYCEWRGGDLRVSVCDRQGVEREMHTIPAPLPRPRAGWHLPPS